MVLRQPWAVVLEGHCSGAQRGEAGLETVVVAMEVAVRQILWLARIQVVAFLRPRSFTSAVMLVRSGLMGGVTRHLDKDTEMGRARGFLQPIAVLRTQIGGAAGF